MRLCQGNAKYAEKVKFPATMFPIQTDTLEESGMLIFKMSESRKKAGLERLKYALDALDQTK